MGVLLETLLETSKRHINYENEWILETKENRKVYTYVKVTRFTSNWQCFVTKKNFAAQTIDADQAM